MSLDVLYRIFMKCNGSTLVYLYDENDKSIATNTYYHLYREYGHRKVQCFDYDQEEDELYVYLFDDEFK